MGYFSLPIGCETPESLIRCSMDNLNLWLGRGYLGDDPKDRGVGYLFDFAIPILMEAAYKAEHPLVAQSILMSGYFWNSTDHLTVRALYLGVRGDKHVSINSDYIVLFWDNFSTSEPVNLNKEII